jgi:hypothetical protein
MQFQVPAPQFRIAMQGYVPDFKRSQLETGRGQLRMAPSWTFAGDPVALPRQEVTYAEATGCPSTNSGDNPVLMNGSYVSIPTPVLMYGSYRVFTPFLPTETSVPQPAVSTFPLNWTFVESACESISYPNDTKLNISDDLAYEWIPQWLFPALELAWTYLVHALYIAWVGVQYLAGGVYIVVVNAYWVSQVVFEYVC